MEKVLSQEELDQLVKDAEAKNAARNRAIYLLQDAKARYVKEKTRARSKKAAMDREEMLKSPRFKCLEEYERKEDIMDAYGWDIITSADVDRLEALWDEREQIKNHVDDNGDYSDLVTKALWEAHKTLIELWQDEIDEAEVTAKKWKEERQKAEMEAKAWLDKQNEEYLKFMGGQ